MALKDPPCVGPGTREVSIKRFTANDPGFRGKYTQGEAPSRRSIRSISDRLATRALQFQLHGER